MSLVLGVGEQCRLERLYQLPSASANQWQIIKPSGEFIAGGPAVRPASEIPGSSCIWCSCGRHVLLGDVNMRTCLFVIKEMAELPSCMETSSKHLDQIIGWLVASWYCRTCQRLHGGRKDALCFLFQSIPPMLPCAANVPVAAWGRLCCRRSGSQQGLYKALLGLQNLLAPFQRGSGDINRTSHFWSLPSIHGKEELCARAVI